MTTAEKASKSSPPRPRACTRPSTLPARPATATSAWTAPSFPPPAPGAKARPGASTCSGAGKHHRHEVNLQVISAPDGYPLWIAQARPGCEHDANAAAQSGIEAQIALFDNGVDPDERLLVLVDSGYEKFRAFPAVIVPHKAPKGGKLTEAQKEWDRLACAKRALAEKANADLTTRFCCLRKVSFNPWKIGTIARACLASFRIE